MRLDNKVNRQTGVSQFYFCQETIEIIRNVEDIRHNKRVGITSLGEAFADGMKSDRLAEFYEQLNE